MPKHLAGLVMILGIALPVIAQSPTGTSPSSSASTTSTATAAPQSASAVPSAKHSITVKFDYDFTRTPPCSATVTTKCVQQFNVYDVSGGASNRIKLFSIPVPSGASGLMKGITGTSPSLVFETGQHFISVTAQPPTGNESSPVACQTSIQINP